MGYKSRGNFALSQRISQKEYDDIFKKGKTMQRKILVTGASGMVGSAIKEVFKSDNLYLTDKHNLDVRDYNQVMRNVTRNFDLIIHLAAETNLEICEKNPEHAYTTNTIGTLNVMLLAQTLNIPMVYISTAGIFDGTKKSYNEEDKGCAINHYGRSKWFGELILNNYKKVWTFRAGWMMGGGPEIDKKFVNIIFKQLKAGKKKLQAVDNAFGSPTYVGDLASTIKTVVDFKPSYGIFNCGGEGIASRFDVACAIVEFLKSDAVVEPVKDGSFSKEFFCTRSASEVLNNNKLNKMGLSKMRPWKESLREYIEKCYSL